MGISFAGRLQAAQRVPLVAGAEIRGGETGNQTLDIREAIGVRGLQRVLPDDGDA
jgi:hypothetical protein